MNRTPAYSLSDFFQMEVVRGKCAEIIVDYYEGDHSKPVRLIGFQADRALPDLTILENGYHYYLRLMGVVSELELRDYN